MIGEAHDTEIHYTMVQRESIKESIMRFPENEISNVIGFYCTCCTMMEKVSHTNYKPHRNYKSNPALDQEGWT